MNNLKQHPNFRTFLVLIFTTLTLVTEGQVICIRCYDQNGRVLTDTNDLMVNGGFELGCVNTGNICPASNGYSCDITNWVCSGGGPSTYAQAIDSNWYESRIAEGNRAVYFGNEHCNVCSSVETDTSCMITSGCEVTGIPFGYPYNTFNYGADTGVSLFQTISGLGVGVEYVLEFWTGGERMLSNPGWFYNDGLFALDIGFGNIFLRDPPTAQGTGIGRRFVVIFNTTSVSHTIKFTSWGHIGGNHPYPCTELVLDDVRLFRYNNSAIPCLTAVESISESSYINVYPNPCTDKLTISGDNNIKSEIVLYDIAGRKILQQEFTGSASLFTGQLINGLYNYEVTSNRRTTRGKLVKQ